MSTKNIKAGLSKANVNAIAGAIGTATLNRLIPIFSTSVAYTKGQYTNYNNQLYRFTADKAAGAWDSSKVESASLNDLIHDVNEAVDTINDKANVDGNYPTMTVGLANNLNSKIMQNDVDAYNFRTAGGSKEIGNICKENAIVGGTIGFNQLLHDYNFPDNSTWWAPFSSSASALTIANNKATVTWVSDDQAYYMYGIKQVLNVEGSKLVLKHVYFAQCFIKSNFASNFNVEINSKEGTVKAVSANVRTDMSTIIKITGNTIYSHEMAIFPMSGLTEEKSYVVDTTQLTDLTAMLGKKIADYVYALEQAEAGAGVAWFRRYWKKKYYPYTPIGSLQHVITRGKQVTGFNLCDEDMEQGDIGTSTGIPYANANCVRTKNFCEFDNNQSLVIRHPDMQNVSVYLYLYDATKDFVGACLLNSANLSIYSHEDYTIVARNYLPALKNAQFFKIVIASGTYDNQLCVNYHYDGERDGEYEASAFITTECDEVPLKGIFDIDEEGNLICDGDRYNNDGAIDEEYGEVDLGSLNWQTDWFAESGRIYADITAKAKGRDNLFCSVYPNAQTDDSNITEKTITGNNSDALHGFVYIKDSSFESASALITSLSGKKLIYKKATPTQSEATEFPLVQAVDNWGSEKYLEPLNDTRPCEVPVGHDTDYPLDCKSKVEIMPNLPTTDGYYVCKVTSVTAEYTSLPTWLQNNGYEKDLQAKENLGGILRQLLAVKESLDFDNTAFVDLGSVNWTKGANAFSTTGFASLFKIPGNNETPKLLASSVYLIPKSSNETSGVAGSYEIWINAQGQLIWYYPLDAYADADAFKNAMKGVLLAYEKASE